MNANNPALFWLDQATRGGDLALGTIDVERVNEYAAYCNKETTMDRATVTGNPPTNEASAPVPTNEKRVDGQHKDHWVLPEAELAKGYVRPYRLTYLHVGPPGPCNPLRDLTAAEQARYAGLAQPYVKYEAYPAAEKPVVGKFWTQEELDRVDQGCRTVTTVPTKVAETYARQPTYYGSTFCCGCARYLPVGPYGEFVWNDGSNDRVGT